MTIEKSSQNLVLQDLIMPSELNSHGTLFGGAMLAYFDKAGAIKAAEAVKSKLMLVAMKEALFKKPSFAGDKLSFYAQVSNVGRTSITIDVEAWRCNVGLGEQPELSATAQLIYVGIDENKKPKPIRQVFEGDAL